MFNLHICAYFVHIWYSFLHISDCTIMLFLAHLVLHILAYWATPMVARKWCHQVCTAEADFVRQA